MSHFGYIGHHLIVAIIDHIPIMESNGWVMFNGDMTNDPCLQSSFLRRYIALESPRPNHQRNVYLQQDRMICL